jgi:hypothetical protein
MIRRTLSTLAALTLAAGLTACSDDKKDPEPRATDSTTSAEPTPTEPAWEDAYTEKQLDGYKAALQRWESYLDRSEPIWAAGKATPQAEDLFKEYFPDPIWRSVYSQLKTYEQVDVKSEGQAEVYWSRAKEISDTALSVTIEQCVNYSTGMATQGGKVVEPEKWATEPRLRTISLSKPKGYGWLIYELHDETSKKRPKKCEP